MNWTDIETMTAMARLSLYLLLITGGSLFAGCVGCLILNAIQRDEPSA